MSTPPIVFSTDAQILAAHTIHGIVPQRVAIPTSQAEASAVMHYAAQHGWTVVPYGGGTRQLYGAPPTSVDLVVSTAGLTRVLQHEPNDLTISVEAGMTAEALRTYLATHGQMIPIDPAVPERTTIGGMIATAADGPRRAQYGVLRDMIIGVHVVEVNGQASRAGGMVVKNVSGFDMMKLYHGSYGTLALITAANFKLIPIPPARGSILIGCATRSEAMSIVATLMQSQLTPVACELLDGAVARSVGSDAAWVVAIGCEGPEPSVERHIRDAVALAATQTATSTIRVQQEHDALWRTIANASACDAMAEGELLLRWATIPAFVGPLLDRISDAGERLGGTPVVHVRASVGCGYVRLTGLDAKQQDAWITALPEVIAVASRERTLARYWHAPAGGAEVMQRIKAEFDPQLRLNPGRFVV
jgi:glycolate oxidase FAD binding subunit